MSPTLKTAPAALLLAFALAVPARAEDAAALYRVYWAGLPAAELRLSVHQEGGAYRDEIAIRTQGLPRLVTHFRATATGAGRIDGTAPPAPADFEARYDLRKRKDRVLSMHFVAAGGATLAERGPRDTSRKPPLATQFRRNVIDPLGALAAIREELRRHVDAFTVPAYDGARRFDVVARVLPGRRDGRVHLALTLRPIAGFKGETSEDGDPDSAPRPVTLTMTGDARLMPLAMEVRVYYLPLTVQLERWCTPAQPCPLNGAD